MLSLQIMFCFTVSVHGSCSVAGIGEGTVCPGPLPLILGKNHRSRKNPRSRKIRKGKQNKTAPSFVAQGLDPPLIPDILVAETKSVTWSKRLELITCFVCSMKHSSKMARTEKRRLLRMNTLSQTVEK